MSVCRFFWDASELYLYYSDRGLECCGCKLREGSLEMDPDDHQEILAHLNEHHQAGHQVLPYVYEEFGGTHPDPEGARARTEAWRAEHPQYSWLWTDDDED